MKNSKKVVVFDTTLRDGEQTPSISITPSNKLEIAMELDKLGVNIIEAGSPITSKGEREAIKQIVNQKLNAEICSFVRSLPLDIDKALECNVDSVHIVIPTSEIHMKYKMKKSKEEIVESALKSIEYAKEHGLVVELSAEDATRSDPEFLIELFKNAEEYNIDRACICDTVGILTPDKSSLLVKKIVENIKTPLSIHCHNDFGMATANTVAGINAGAKECHVTVNGLGERAGNAPIDEVVMTLDKLYDIKSDIVHSQLSKTSRLISKLVKVPIPANKSIVGENAFSHEAGIHVDGLIKNTSTYEPILPEEVGNNRKIILGKHSGKSALKYKLSLMNIGLNNKEFNQVYDKVKAYGDLGKYISDIDLKTIISEIKGVNIAKKVYLDELTVISGNKVTPLASINLKFAEDYNPGGIDSFELSDLSNSFDLEDSTNIRKRGDDRKISKDIKLDNIREAAYGVGPVDAAINAVRKALTGVADIELEGYTVKAVSSGTDALIEVIVNLRRGNEVVEVKKAHSDIIEASVEALMDGINLLL
ncbi:D-citramalate synthase [Methanococcus voltae]|uniref:(R)-citramalate synthase n=1 Tax=Methanococcus voltae TaxID=2188 RepID=UPI001AEABABF|nr:(R)-citramalate synthase [Methanococcus voltae]MBP2144157.1 D-citramalate synthase [Methanococcus voltae]